MTAQTHKKGTTFDEHLPRRSRGRHGAADGPGRTGRELAQRLSRLEALRSGGLISESEYAEQRGRIIGQL